MTHNIHHKIREKNTFMVYYQCFIAISAILVFFTRLDGFLGAYGIGMPLYWFVVFTVLSIPLFLSILSQGKLWCIPIPIIVWSCIYISMSSVSILISSQYPDMQLMEDQIRSILFLLLMLVIFSQDTLVKKWVKLTILFVTFANVFIYIYEFLNPSAFALIKDVPGRSGGFYVDSNTASCALIFGLIFSIDLFKPKYRIFYALFVLLGIATTFSRGGMACWLLVIIMFMILKIIPLSQLPLLFLSVFLAVTIVSNQVNNLAFIKNADGSQMFTDGTIRRVEFLINPLQQDEEDFDDSRLKLADEAWAKFVNKPFLGNGLGGARVGLHHQGDDPDEEGSGTHNIYLDSILKYGFLGITLYPGLLMAILWKVKDELKPYAIVFFFFSFAWGFFSHTIFNAFFSVIVNALMASWVYQSRFKNSFNQTSDGI